MQEFLNSQILDVKALVPPLLLLLNKEFDAWPTRRSHMLNQLISQLQSAHESWMTLESTVGFNLPYGGALLARNIPAVVPGSLKSK